MNLLPLKSLIWLPVFLLLFGCKQKNADKASDIATIEIVQNLGKFQAVPLSEFVTELEYIPLETCDDCLIAEWNGGYNHIIVTTSHIFVAGYNFCYAFDRDGRFIGKLGSVGQGPGEYSDLRGLSIDENKQSVYINARYSVMEYSYDGVFRRSFSVPQTRLQLHNHPSESEYTNRMNNIYFVRDNLFIGHTLNFMGNEKYNFHLINDSAQLVKSFNNHVQFNRIITFISYPNEEAMRPYRVMENIYVKEVQSDTVFCLNTQNELIPKFVFNLGRYAYRVEDRIDRGVPRPLETWKELQLKVIYVPAFLSPMVGSPNYIFFSYRAWNLSGQYAFPYQEISQPPAEAQNVVITDNIRHLGIYDIINQKTQLLDIEPVSKGRGLINDLDGGLPFWPKYYTSDNELIDIWQVYDMKEYFTDAYFAAHEIKNPQAHQKLKELLKNVDEYDNPVVVIAKLKK